jgi:ADP-heptose:LPS heptosyltransferase
MIIKTDCIHFKGDIPCFPNKMHGYHCECMEYKKIQCTILIIKLGAIGDIIRTTPLLRRIRKEFPDAYITWLTYSSEILSPDWVDRILKVSAENIEFIKNIKFDWVINLDKDPIAISLTNTLKAKRKSGYTIDEWGHARAISSDAEKHKWLTGIFDDLSKQNKKHYVEEMFDICGFEFNDEEYIINVDIAEKEWNIDKSKRVVGLNTGCGGRWSSRLWPKEYWVKLAKDLLENNFEVILLGGEQENEKNKIIAELSGAKYFGYFSILTFISLLNECELIITAVTLAMHLSIALKKKLILFNNIFNKNEFYLYGRGQILEPEFDCNCYYSPVCGNNCMQYIYPEKVYFEVNKILGLKP